MRLRSDRFDRAMARFAMWYFMPWSALIITLIHLRGKKWLAKNTKVRRWRTGDMEWTEYKFK